MIEAMNIPEKSHFKLNEVCGITGVKPYVLRFWESEFNEISPIVSSSGQKLYEHKDIEAIAYIKKLLFEDKLTVERAKRELSHCLSAKIEAEEVEEAEEDNRLEDDQSLSLDVAAREKLLVAKQRLNQMLNLTESLQKRHNWSE